MLIHNHILNCFSSLRVFSSIFKLSLFTLRILLKSSHSFLNSCPRSLLLSSAYTTLQHSSISLFSLIENLRYASSLLMWEVCKKDKVLLRLAGDTFFISFKTNEGCSLFSKASIIYSPCLRSSYLVFTSLSLNFSVAYSSIITLSIFFSSWSPAIV